MPAPGQRIIRTSVDWSSTDLVLVQFLAGRFTYRSAEEWSSRINSGEITVNGKTVAPEYILQMHDSIEYRPQDIPEPPARTDYRIIHEDDALLVIDKPGNLCVHPSGPFYQNTLWYLLRQKYQNIHFVNRLDRETSGLLLAAKSAGIAGKIAENQSISCKKYLAIVHGCFAERSEAAGFLVSANSLIRKKRKFIRKNPDSLPGETSLTTLEPVISGKEFSLVQATLGTGRTHQIRATLYSLGYPLVGDKLYGVDERFFLKQKSEDFTPEDRAKLLLKRQALHSASFDLVHPVSGETLHFDSDLPGELRQFVKKNITH
ncbi:MAG: RluA family pseudouridine synthase [Lentisphaerae bacterium]|nr:RluA family pseudouridine synthase [Lentisphaerota bacterium]